MRDDPEETQEVDAVEPKGIAGEVVSAGRQKLRQAVQYGVSAAVGMVALVAMSWAMSAVQSRAPVGITGAVAPAQAQGVATWTATPAWGRSAELQVGDRVEGAPTPTPASDTEARLWRIIEDLEGRLLAAQQRNIVLETEIAETRAAQDGAPALARSTQDVLAESGPTEPRPWESVHIQPDLGEGSECTPPNRGIVLCGVPDGAAYAVYDARGSRYPDELATVPSAAEMAQHLGRDAQPVELWRHGSYSIHYHPEAQEIAVFHGVVCIWARNRLGKVRHG